jgi:hypothetical protein
MCIGAQKAGTTWLHAMLGMHPDIFLPPEKELHYWNRSRALRAKQLASYLGKFPDTKLGGDITPAYALLPVSVIREIRRLNPGLRIIYIIRNPIDRAWSMARAALKSHRRRFSRDLISTLQGRPPGSKKWFITHFHSAASTSRGRYAQTIERWTSVFPDDQFLLLRYEDMTNDPDGFLHRCCLHIGVKPDPLNALANAHRGPRVNASPEIAMDRKLFDELLGIYRMEIATLESRLGWDLREWLTPPPAKQKGAR